MNPCFLWNICGCIMKKDSFCTHFLFYYLGSHFFFFFHVYLLLIFFPPSSWFFFSLWRHPSPLSSILSRFSRRYLCGKIVETEFRDISIKILKRSLVISSQWSMISQMLCSSSVQELEEEKKWFQTKWMHIITNYPVISTICPVVQISILYQHQYMT